MNTTFYLDNYNLICSNLNESFLSGNIKLLKNGKEITCTLNSENNILTIAFSDVYEYGDELTVLLNGESFKVVPRFIFHTKKFDFDFCPDIETLGSFYHSNYTVFRLWSPLSEGAYVVIDNEPYRMAYTESGVYEARIKGNLEEAKYHYEVIRNGETSSFKDIFAYSNTIDNKDSYVLNLKKLNSKKIKVKQTNDPIIYELSVRDFSSDTNAPFINKGKFLAFLEEGLKINDKAIGIDYLKDLGISHVQLMPINNYDLDNYEYGWGYNPVNYNSLYWGYVVGEDGYAPIKEFRSLVNKLHEVGLHVNIDVVFNHIFETNDKEFDRMLPYYFFRYNKNGRLANGSYCGNEIRSEAKFVRAYLTLLIKRYIKYYDIDGIRFDLAGLIDLETTKQMISASKDIKNDFMMYGEGWNMGNNLQDENKTIIENANSIKEFAFFNGKLRDDLKGPYSEKYTKGYLLGNKTVEEDIKNEISGSYNIGLNPNQSINYIECHDNYTFYDKVSFFNYDEETKKKICKSGLASILLSSGIPFIHAGQEFLRTKNGVDNSYNLNDEINLIDWHRMVENKEIVDYFKELIKFRKENSIFKNEEVSFSYYYDLLICCIKDVDIFINPTEYPYVYTNWITYKQIINSNGENLSNLSTFDIDAYSFVVAVKS